MGVAFLARANYTIIRDDEYYLNAALRMLRKWRIITEREDVPSLESRGLAPRQPNDDQRLMLRVRDIEKKNEFRQIMRNLVPFFKSRLHP